MNLSTKKLDPVGNVKKKEEFSVGKHNESYVPRLFQTGTTRFVNILTGISKRGKVNYMLEDYDEW